MPMPNTVTGNQIMELIERQSFRCPLSGRTLTPQTASLDHIVPLARGGQHGLANVWVVDHQVNTAKGTLSLDDFIAMCREVVEHQRAVVARKSAG